MLCDSQQEQEQSIVAMYFNTADPSVTNVNNEYPATLASVGSKETPNQVWIPLHSHFPSSW